MRVLIYGEGPAAAAILQREREAGNHASYRTPEMQYFDVKRLESADKIYTDVSEIYNAYFHKGFDVDPITPGVPMEVAEPPAVEEPIEPLSDPKGGIDAKTVAAVVKKVKSARK